jgi:hypothetical protein
MFETSRSGNRVVLRCGHKLNTDRRWDGKRLAARCKATRGLVDVEDYDRVRILICRQKKPACGIQREVATCLSSGGNNLHLCQGTLLGIDGEYGYAVVASVRRIHEVAGVIQLDFSRVIHPRRTRR